MLGPRTLRDRSASRDPDAGPPPPPATKNEGKKEARERMSHAGWTEPSLAQKPSHRDHNGGSYYSVSEHMQPLGELPNARVKTRVKMDGPRKSVLGKGAGAAGADAQETPEGTPGPQTGTQAEGDTSSQPPVTADDEGDEDYAPAGNGKKAGKRVAKPRTSKRASTTAASSKTRHATAHDGADTVNQNRVYDKVKMKQVAESAMARATAVGKTETAAAIQEIYLDSLKDARLTELLEHILLQSASKAQMSEFHEYVRAAKRRIREGKASSQAARDLPGATNGTKSLTLRAPNFTSSERHNTKPSTALPSTEQAEPPRPKISLKAKPRPADSARRPPKSSGGGMSPSPLKKRSGSVESDSSLTDMTSNPDDNMDVDRVEDGEDNNTAAAATNGTGTGAKDHAAERGSLAPPHRNLKRSSAEAELAEEASDRLLAAKKQKLSETIRRDEAYEESNLRGASDEPATRNRSLRSNKDTPMTSPQSTSKTNGVRGARTRGGNAASHEDPDSPLSELSPMSSRQTSPHIPAGVTGNMMGKKAKTKQSPEKKTHVGRGMTGLSGVGAESPIGDEDNEELSENNDFCSACGGSGFLLCCDGCDRSFHFSCLDPPLNEDASELNEPWYCYICVAKRPVTSTSPEKPLRGLFAPLFGSLKKRNPSNFSLPQEIRDYFEGVATDRNGSFVEAVHTKTKTRSGYDETPDFTKLKDAKGNPILCYSCDRSSLELGAPPRPIIQCDYCGQNWHLDCLDPPLANPPARNLEGKKLHDWMCPLHADHELRKVDTSLLNRRSSGRKVHIRKPRNAKVVETSLRRGLRNNGIIEVIDDDSDDSGSEFYDEDNENTVVYRMPASGIKLDFIDKVKSTRVQQLRTEHAFSRASIAAPRPPRPLQQANFARRSFAEQQMALNLVQFANEQHDIDLGRDKIESLLATLIAEAPSDVVKDSTADEEKERARSASSVIPPSPPSSEQPGELSAEQRKQLELLQELIRRRLGNPTT